MLGYDGFQVRFARARPALVVLPPQQWNFDVVSASGQRQQLTTFQPYAGGHLNVGCDTVGGEAALHRHGVWASNDPSVVASNPKP